MPVQPWHALLPRRAGPVAFTPQALAESTAVLRNPDQGFYRIVPYTLNEEGAAGPACGGEYPLPLVLLEINLRNYRTGPLSDRALGQLADLLHGWAGSGARLLLRFLYDWDGVAKAWEPESLSTILTHMDQVGEVVNRYEAAVYLMQGVFVGSWGEMHGSAFTDDASLKTLALHLHEVIAPSIYLCVRTPAQWRMITGQSDAPSDRPALRERGPIAHRLGLFNDGMLGSASDLGTYGTTLREEELTFQNRLCRFVPNGGEVVHDTPFSALMAAVPYLKTIHVSYLNADYDPTVLQKWSRTIWNAEDAFSGCDGLTYVQAHLGYRYTARAFTLQKQGVLSPRLTFRLTLENTGFSNALRPLTGAFLLRNARTGETRRAPVAFDFRTLTSGQAQTLTASLPAGELPRGSWQIFFSVTDDATGRQIALANTTFVEGSGVLLGRVDCSGAFQEGG